MHYVIIHWKTSSIWYTMTKASVKELVCGVKFLHCDQKCKGNYINAFLYQCLYGSSVTRYILPLSPYALLYADDVFLVSHSKIDLDRLVQKWNSRLTQHGVWLNLNKTEVFTDNPMK